METINRLLNKEYYIIDYLPVQVPKNSKGQFFEVESYLLSNMERYGLPDRFIGIILKVMCYYRTSVLITEEWIEQPSPDLIVGFVERIMQNHSGAMNVFLPEKDVLLVVDGDCLHITVYNPDEEMCNLMKNIAASEGMFFRKGLEDATDDNV